MALNQTTLRGILAAITSVDEKFIVPKQGNWWNPQEQLRRPDTWCAYMIRESKPRTVPFNNDKEASDVPKNSVAVMKLSAIDLQFVGKKAEEIANSVAFWPWRSDVAEQFKTVRGSLMNDDLTARSSNFYQDGQNNVVAWNVTIRVLWYDVVDTSQIKVVGASVSGSIKNRL